MIFQLSEVDLTSKWGRILPAVYWLHQNNSNYIIRRSTASCDIKQSVQSEIPSFFIQSFSNLNYWSAWGLVCVKLITWMGLYTHPPLPTLTTQPTHQHKLLVQGGTYIVSRRELSNDVVTLHLMVPMDFW